MQMQKSKPLLLNPTFLRPQENFLHCLRLAGFSLSELLIALAIGEAVLLDLAGKMEQFYGEHNSYAGATIEKLGGDDSSYKKYYQVAIKSGANNYTFSAKPLGAQAKADTDCGSLSIDQDGNKKVSGVGGIDGCWR